MTNELLQQLKLGAESLKSTLGSGIGSAQEFIRLHPVTSGVTIGGGLLAGAGLIATQVIKKKSKAVSGAPRKRAKSVSKRKKYHGHTLRGWKQDRRLRSKEKHELAYQRRKKLKGSGSRKKMGKIYYTKKGQPYKIKADGRALFIKKTKRRSR